VNCEACLERILEADPSVLRGAAPPESDLAAHLADCARCRAAAERVLAREEEMRTVWQAAVPARWLEVPDVSVDRLAAANIAELGVAPATARRSRARRHHKAAWLVPLATAAALGGVLALRWDDVAAHFGQASVERTAAAVRLLYPPPTVPETPVVNAAPGGGVAVLRTNDPRITLILNF
jgi:hypothetical protein